MELQPTVRIAAEAAMNVQNLMKEDHNVLLQVRNADPGQFGVVFEMRDVLRGIQPTRASR
jgi:hypothetical protein